MNNSTEAEKEAYKRGLEFSDLQHTYTNNKTRMTYSDDMPEQDYINLRYIYGCVTDEMHRAFINGYNFHCDNY